MLDSASFFFLFSGEQIPRFVIRRRQAKIHRRAGFRVQKLQPVRPECNLAAIILLRVQGIFPISYQRQPPAGKLGPDLMGPACVQHNPHSGHSSTNCLGIVLQHRLLHAAARLVCDIGFAFPFVAQQQVTHHTARGRWNTMYHSQIFFLHLVFPNLARQL